MNLKCDVYLVHYKPLTERLNFMTEQLEKHGVQLKKIICSEPPDNWSKNDIQAIRNKLSFFHNNNPSFMSKQEASLAWKHFEFIYHASKNDKPSLVLEDDAILANNFVNSVNDILLETTWDVVFPGSGCNLRTTGKGLIKVNHPASKCTDSYIITPESAKKIYATMLQSLDLAIDWELNYQMMHHDLRVFWLEPPIVRQGSQDGTWISSISNKKENLFL